MKKKITVTGFIQIWFAALWGVSCIMMIALYFMLSDHLQNTLIRKHNRENMQLVENHVVFDENGGISVSEPVKLDKGYYVVIMSMEHEVLCGTFPNAFAGYDYDRRKDGVIELKGKKYLLTYEPKLDRDRTRSYVSCGIADIAVASTILDDIRLSMIGFLILAMAGMIVVCVLMNRRIAGPLNKMSEDVKNLEKDMTYSGEKLMESGFREIDMLEEAYMRLFEKMSSVIESQNRFNSDVSHELRTPITVIQTQGQISKERALESGDTESAEMMDVIIRQTEKMNRIINILMRLSKLENGAAKLSIEQFDLAMLIESVCEDEEFEASTRWIMVYELKETIILADVNLITIAVRNILSNAFKYSREGSEIRIRCGTSGGRPFCSITDHGIGINEEAMGRIYDNFYRAEESRASEGVGLGLSLTKKIMELHGGEVRAESVPGEGSTFTLWFAEQCESKDCQAEEI